MLFKAAKIQFLGVAINTIHKTDRNKAGLIYHSIDNETIIAKITEADLQEIAKALNLLNIVSVEKAQAIFEQIDEVIIEKISQANLQEIAKALNLLNIVSKEKTKAIFEAIKDEIIISKISEANLVEIGIGHALNELNIVSKEKTKAIIEAIKDEIIISKISEANLVEIGHALSELNIVSAAKTKTIFEQIPIFLLVDKAGGKILTYKHLSNILWKLAKVSETHTTIFFQELIKAQKLSVKALATEMERHGKGSLTTDLNLFYKMDFDDKAFTKDLLQNLDIRQILKDTFFKRNIGYFNGLFSLYARMDFSYTEVTPFLDFARNKNILGKLLSETKIRTIGGFLEVYKYYELAKTRLFITENRNKIVTKLLFLEEEQWQFVPKFIAIVLEIDEKSGLFLLQKMQEHQGQFGIAFIGRCHAGIWQSYKQMEKPQQAEKHYTLAHACFTEVNDAEGLAFLAQGAAEENE